jgi:hypothetical protein
MATGTDKRRKPNRKTAIRVSYKIELDPFQQELLDYHASQHGITETTRARRIAKLLRYKGENEIHYIMENYTCHRCGDMLSRGDEGYGTSRGECRKCIEKEIA